MSLGSSELSGALLAQDRGALARLITLAESRRPKDGERVSAVLGELRSNHSPPAALRLAFTGAPGVGKSSLIERFGLELVGAGQRIAVLALDPSSPESGGSVLGDRTRMPSLSQSERAFIRPSPARDALGGIGDATLHAIELCEWAGYDPVVVETVGVGQSELDVRAVADCIVLVLAPDLGDEIQGLKRGITEICDLVVVNKHDLSPERAENTGRFYQAALGLRSRDVPVLSTSAAQGTGVTELVAAVRAFQQQALGSGVFELRRRECVRLQLRRAVERRFRRALEGAPSRAEVEARVMAGEVTLEQAADLLWRALS